MQFTGHSLPAHHFFYGTVRIFTLSHFVSQAVFYNMTDSLLIAVHAFVSRVSMSVPVDETLLPW